MNEFAAIIQCTIIYPAKYVILRCKFAITYNANNMHEKGGLTAQ